ncbi:hypothetical protein [Shimia sp. SDUM112013]|uniref:hypothetical protein n=1 Tax=Shimia sp. SDUM112013 TaxID=3136160 RepID=UPI0032F08631
MIADALLVLGAIGAGLYCLILGRRLSRFNNLQTGVGGAVALLSAQVDDLTKALAEGKEAAQRAAEDLTELTRRADESSKRLELLVASMHDLPSTASQPTPNAEKEAVFFRHPAKATEDAT